MRKLGPGCWDAGDGTMRVDLPELLAHLGWPDTPKNRRLALEGIRDAGRDAGVAVEEED